MPNIRVSDDVYSKLKKFADSEMRSVANATEFLLVKGLGGAPNGYIEEVEGDIKASKQAYSPSKTPTSLYEKRGEILAKITQLTNKRDEDLEYCQDGEIRKQIESQYQADIQPLWDEFHLLSEEEKEEEKAS